MLNPNSLEEFKNWWNQFPVQLKLIAQIRFLGSFGAGGVIYLTSLIFNNIGLTATEIGFGFTLSAIAGTATRLFTGKHLNKNKNIWPPIIISSLLSISSSILLLFSKDIITYSIGQALIGAAAGVYWPSVEIAVPYYCYPIKTVKAYALARSSEALGIFLGVFTGSFFSSILFSKAVFLNDILCMVFILILITNNNYFTKALNKDHNTSLPNSEELIQRKWNKNSFIIFLSIILLTTCQALIQVTLPLDFVKGGINRIAISANSTSYIISLQLFILFLFQWPIGSWLSSKGQLYGLKFSLFNFFFSTFLLFLSGYFHYTGIVLMLLAIIFCCIGISSFLPVCTDIVFKLAPIHKKGFALALLSQCFAIGYFFGPLISGSILDYYGFASIIWGSISALCLVSLILLFKKELKY